MPDCTDVSHYSYTQDLTKAQWAWEFLRRNPDYQKDYQWFISQWRALEKDYGRSPDMDYQAWKQEPRSYKIIDINSEQDGNCAISDDKLLIECWNGLQIWMSCLRLLDAQSLQVNEVNQVTAALNSNNIKLISCEADYYINHYLQILTLMEK